MKKLAYILVSIVLLFAFTAKVSADELVLSKSDTLLRAGDTFQVTVALENYEEDIQGIQGLISFDSNYLTLKAVQNSVNWEYGNSNLTSGRFMYAGSLSSFIKADTNVFTLTFEAKQQGQTTVQLKELVASTSGVEVVLNSAESNALTIDIERALIRNANLATLTSSTGYFSPSFDANTTSYKLYVPYETSSVKLAGTLASGYSKVTGLGEFEFKEASKTVSIVVTAEYGNTKTYTIEIVRLRQLSNNNELEKLEIKDIDFELKKDKFEYTLTVPYDQTSLDITAITKDANAKVSIIGNTDLKVGENIVTITVTAENGEEKVYTLKVTREEEKVAEEPTVEEEKKDNDNAKLLIIILIIATVLGLAYLFFKKDKDEPKKA